MTVQEAKDVLDNLWDFGIISEEDDADILEKAVDVAIESIEEVEQYRALGTVEELKEAREKQVAKIKFDNACGCIFDEEVLFNAIDLECRNRNCYRQDEYKIYLYNDYPCISLGHDKVRIHILIGKLIFGNIRKGYVIHHKDHNKLNALPSNLEYISNSVHTKLHHKGEDFRSEEGKQRSINSAREKTYKKEITKAEIESMLLQGKTKTEIAKHFQCGVNTIYRRLGYKC